MNNSENKLNEIDEGENKLFVDLIFDLAAGESFREGCSYEEQLEYFVIQVLPTHANFDGFVEYGQKYRMASKYMFLGKLDQIKNRGLLMKLFSSFVVLKELFDCNSIDIATDQSRIVDNLSNRYEFVYDNDLSTYTREIAYLARGIRNC